MIQIQPELDFIDRKITKVFHKTITIDTKFRFGSSLYCTYCGDSPNQIDHCIPFSFLTSKVSRNVSDKNRGVTCYCCSECNTLLNDRFFRTFRERVMFINAKLRHRHAKILRQPYWERDELNELDHKLRSFVVNNQKKKAHTILRVDWPGTSDFEGIINRVRERSELLQESSEYNRGLDHFFSGSFEGLCRHWP